MRGGVGGRRGRVLDHIDDPWTKNVYKVASTGRSACLCIFSEEYWHRIGAAFSTGRLGPEQRRGQGRKPVAASDNSSAAAAVSPKCNKERECCAGLCCAGFGLEDGLVWSACISLEVWRGASLRGRPTPGQMTDVAQHSTEMVSSACSQAVASLLDASACLLSL